MNPREREITMYNIPELRSYVQSVQNFQLKQVRRKTSQNNNYAAQKHEKTASQMGEVIAFLDSLPQDEDGNYCPSEPTPTTYPMQPDLFTISESELSDMPESVLKSLKLSKTDELEVKIIELIKIAGRPLSIKELIIGLYKKYQYEVTDRNPFASKLYRMSNAEKIMPIEGKKGYYGLVSSFVSENKQEDGDE